MKHRIYFKNNKIILLFLICMISSMFNNCSKNYNISNPELGTSNEPSDLKNDNYEPNDTRETAYKLGKIPIKPLEGVLISEKDIDWYKFTFTTPDSQFVKFIPNTEKTSEYFGIVIGLFDTSKHPKGIIYYYQGPPSDAVTKFSWKLGSGDYFFYVKIDTSYVKKAGQYCFDITRQSKLPGRYSAITGI